jgi:hypothetical protein
VSGRPLIVERGSRDQYQAKQEHGPKSRMPKNIIIHQSCHFIHSCNVPPRPSRQSNAALSTVFRPHGSVSFALSRTIPNTRGTLVDVYALRDMSEAHPLSQVPRRGRAACPRCGCLMRPIAARAHERSKHIVVETHGCPECGHRRTLLSRPAYALMRSPSFASRASGARLGTWQRDDTPANSDRLNQRGGGALDSEDSTAHGSRREDVI